MISPSNYSTGDGDNLSVSLALSWMAGMAVIMTGGPLLAALAMPIFGLAAQRAAPDSFLAQNVEDYLSGKPSNGVAPASAHPRIQRESRDFG